jgi:tyrosine-specific transport protein
MDNNTQKNMQKTGLVAATALITGNLVGAGILGLPINTGLAGLGPSMLAILAGAGLMYLSASILGDEAARNRSETFDYPSMYEALLGKTGKWIAMAANLLILYGLLTAYFTGGAKILASLFGMESRLSLVMLLFSLPLIALTSINLSFLARLNTLFIAVLALLFAALLALGAGHVQVKNMAYMDWRYLPATLPIIITAFHFHNIIPTISTSLAWDRTQYRKAVFWGMALAFAMNGLWILVGIGVIPLTGENSLLSSWETNMPATVPMAFHLQSQTFTLCALAFALVAISTSFLANGLGLQNFIRDLLTNTFHIESRSLVLALTFLPPLAIALVYPDIFLKALDLVGGVGIVILFGLLPLLIALRDPNRSRVVRGICVLAFSFALAILAMEILQEAGLLRLRPWVEYYKIDF